MNPPAADKPVIVLIGNYPPDRQESMLRFRDLVAERLEAAGFLVESISPQGRVGPLVKPGGGLSKWLGYIDKYVLFPVELMRRLSQIKRSYQGQRVVVHICDHSNAVYAKLAKRWFRVLITCHDLIAVRSARGEDTDCPVSGFGKYLQEAVLRGLGYADGIACVSRATQSDLIRLAGTAVAGRSRVVPLALNYPYRVLPQDETLKKLTVAGLELPYRGYVLHVGSGLWRKNREALFQSVAQIKDSWSGLIVFAGEPLSPELWALARSLELEERVREIVRPDNETLVALYNAALAFVFMSRFEGFGWPILEAQACGCPLICSNRTSVPEVAGEGAVVLEPEDYGAIAGAIQRLQQPAFRDNVTALGFKNVQNYSSDRMMDAYENFYRRIA
jgi:glycosyltransferase involved in cell wall biosynthesis